jgi:hypothetical protein
MSMQSGLGRPLAGARQAGIYSRWGRVCALLLSLSAAACANIGQIGNLTETRRYSVAFESMDGPPPAVLNKLVQTLKEEANARQIAVVSPTEADFRVRGYLAAHPDQGATTVTWAWDVYDANQRRAFRLGGSERAGGGGSGSHWAGADEALLRKIARTGIEQFAQFAATSRPAGAPALAEAPPPPEPRRSMFAWIDDWTPEAAGIFRIFRSDEPKAGTAMAAASDRSQAGEIPLPRTRPAPAGTMPDPDPAFAFAAPDR